MKRIVKPLYPIMAILFICVTIVTAVQEYRDRLLNKTPQETRDKKEMQHELIIKTNFSPSGFDQEMINFIQDYP